MLKAFSIKDEAYISTFHFVRYWHGFGASYKRAYDTGAYSY